LAGPVTELEAGENDSVKGGATAFLVCYNHCYVMEGSSLLGVVPIHGCHRHSF